MIRFGRLNFKQNYQVIMKPDLSQDKIL